MPYIKQNARIKFNEINDIAYKIQTKGELEYCIFTLMTRFMNKNEFNYSNLHDITYAAIHCGDEFRRRYLDRREDDAKERNGDI